MTTESSTKKEILKLEATKEALLSEDDILWENNFYAAEAA